MRDCDTQLGIYIFSLIDQSENVLVSDINRRKGRFLQNLCAELDCETFFLLKLK